MSIINDANKYLHEKPTAFMTKERRLEKSAVLIEKLVKEIERRDAVFEAAKNYINLSPCDPDITKEQWAAWQKYEALLEDK